MASVLVAPPTPHYYYTFTFHFAPRRTRAPQFHISLRDHPTSPLVYSHLTLSSHAHDALHFHFSLRPHAISALPASARNSHLTYDFLRVFTFHFSKNASFHVSLSGQKLGTGDLVVWEKFEVRGPAAGARYAIAMELVAPARRLRYSN